MKKLTIIGLLCTTLMLWPAAGRSQTATRELIESLYGFRYGPDGLSFQVYSGGCTQKSDFVVMTSEGTDGVIRIVLVRVRADGCEAFMPYGTFITFSFDDLGLDWGDEFEVVNPLKRLAVFLPW